MKAIITLEENSPSRVEIEKEGAMRTVFMEMQELADFIVSSVKEDDEHLQEQQKEELVTVSPSLPLNTVKYAKMSNDADLIFMVHPETNTDVRYHKDVFEQVPFPNLLFCFGVRNNNLTKKMVVAYKDRFLRDDTLLYRFPYSNVYMGGNMCYHNNDKIQDLVQLQSFPYNWMNLDFNDHLYTQGSTNSLNKPVREIYNETQHQPFNYDMLVPMNTTFGQWASTLLK
ncbi:hypothetical protein C2I27_03675 [Priestia megaterium]|uniref:hypothetical protein n=1 Tax=Priestia megaterium TaxID=1404 RepID=UPI000D52465A|nr:hypothetical protein [Priestia megaterium]PVC74999.1 hypothetical protein C2I27_03675 [Priestia megaterium]